jgi:hypothetical protein
MNIEFLDSLVLSKNEFIKQQSILRTRTRDVVENGMTPHQIRSQN